VFVDLCILSNCSVLLTLCNSTDFVVQEFLFAVFQCFPINIVMLGTHVCLYIHKFTYFCVNRCMQVSFTSHVFTIWTFSDAEDKGSLTAGSQSNCLAEQVLCAFKNCIF